MTPNEAFLRYRVKAEGNGLNIGVAVDKGRFILKFNEAYNRFIEYALDKRNQDDILIIQHLLEDDYEIKEKVSKYDHVNFPLPTNFFDLSSVFLIADSKKAPTICKNKKIELYQIKDENKSLYLSDELQNPSFLWRTAPYSVMDKHVKVYTQQQFNPKSLFLTYYRYPTQLALVDPLNPESDFKNTEIEGGDKLIDRIITLAVSNQDLEMLNQRTNLNKLQAKSKL